MDEGIIDNLESNSAFCGSNGTPMNIDFMI